MGEWTRQAPWVVGLFLFLVLAESVSAAPSCTIVNPHSLSPGQYCLSSPEWQSYLSWCADDNNGACPGNWNPSVHCGGVLWPESNSCGGYGEVLGESCTCYCPLTVCDGGQCLAGSGQSCQLDVDCCSGLSCVAGSCQVPACGDGKVNQASEQCDDGNSVDGDACKNNCQWNVCGDGIVDSTDEQCDLGSANNGACPRTCSASCTNNNCGAPCNHECPSNGARQCSGSAAYQVCGNYDNDTCREWGPVTSCLSGENCSGGFCASNPCPPDGDGDGHLTNISGCGGDCNDNNPNIHPNAAEICGNNIDENCNGMSDDTCSATCNAPPDCFGGACSTGSCAMEGAACVANCWGNAQAGDTTRDECEWFECVAGGTTQIYCDTGMVPAGCCGNGATDPGEQCDDGNTNSGDGCSSTCQPDGSGPPPSCVPAAEVCWDGLDNDCDTLTDCADSDCAASPSCTVCSPPFCGAMCGWTVDSCGSPYFCGGCLGGYLCMGNTCVDCDADDDGFLRTGACGGNDCDDYDADVNPGKVENNPLRYCTDAKDNNCQLVTREADYDGYTNATAPQIGSGVWPKGDSACRVGVSAISASSTLLDTEAECYVPFTVSCTANVAHVRSVELSVPGVNCEYDWTYGTQGWTGSQVRFRCNVPADGTYTATCLVNTEESYAIGGQESRSMGIEVDCWRGVAGTVMSRGTPIQGAVVSVVGTAISQVTNLDGTYSTAPDVLQVGTYVFRAEAPDGYYNSEFTRQVKGKPNEVVDFELDPWQCTPQCTFGEGDRCDYTCLDDAACSLGVPVADQERFMSICNNALKGSTREFNSTHTALCCTGPISPKEEYLTPLSLSTCAEQLVPHTVIVNHDGRIRHLTIVTYRRCG